MTAHGRLAPNALQDCPSRGCHNWHITHGLQHVCGEDQPSHLRVAVRIAVCPRCHESAPISGGRIGEHTVWRTYRADDGRALRVPTDVVCSGTGIPVPAGAA